MKAGLAALGLMACAGSLAGCGGGQDDTATDETGGNATPADEVVASGGSPAAAVDGSTGGGALADFTPDAARGKTVFLRCKACHSTVPGQNGIGPSLAGIVGRKSASIEGFGYSAAARDSGLTWTKDELFTFLEQPQRTIPGTRMAFAGLRNGQDRADVIAYLENPAE